MTVKELFESIDIDEFSNFYNLYDNIVSSRKRSPDKFVRDVGFIKSCMLKMLEITPTFNDECIIFCTPPIGSIYLDSYLVHKADLLNKSSNSNYVEHYAYEFEDWKTILGYQISDACIHYICDDMKLAASIFYEMTFFGYSEKEQSATAEIHLQEMDESIKSIENNVTESWKSIDEIFESVGYVDKRDTKTKEFDNIVSELENNIITDMKDKLYDLEIHFLKLKENA